MSIPECGTSPSTPAALMVTMGVEPDKNYTQERMITEKKR